ncbi:Alcohol dehydrogenase superfamily, zinc-type [Niveomyces insectorum RCEF 264]|uniref:Alcohol dehydrogenase superfamily, zinc-type n=1 Tax=Niveomyces insectorum RCEF 264 TaxID=1081102 RepID=A0A167P420_9HYPO|nr:Alcohol dehydrogenase superfamily, zinc-type [Niveomyces insectorum RCEF 264]
MRAVQITGNAASPKVAMNLSVAKPIPKGSEILIRVCAAGVTGDEVLWPELYKSPSRIPGHDVSGVVHDLGLAYNGPLKIGQDVVALLAAGRGEGQADYTICFDDEVALKPASLTHKEAAALPIPLLTTWQAIVDHGKLTAGTRVLVTGASGAVGTLAVQLAMRLAGANVIALASSDHHGALKQLGVDEVQDYNTPGWNSNIKDVEVVIDTVGGDILAKTWETVKSDGTIVTVGDPPPEWAFGRGIASESVRRPNVRYVHFIVRPDSHMLSQALEMVGKGVIKPLDVESFRFENAELAWERARQRRRSKKVVITFEG